MHIIVVGGAGDMGRVACATTAADPAITSVLIADRDGERAAALADELGAKASSMTLDITDSAAMADAFSKVDLVVNTVGPFYLFGPPVLEAAIDAGVHYVDIADDWEPTIEMFGQHERAEAAGVTAIIGMGASPGISNLLAAVARDQLDSVETLHTVWRGGVGIPPVPDDPSDVKPSAAIDHWMHNLAEPIQLWRDGEFQKADALEEFTIDYPGIGSATLWTCGHPEPISLPRTYPELRHSVNAMFGRPGLMRIAREIRDRVRAGELTIPQASRELLLTPGRNGPAAGDIPRFPGTFAYAEGIKDGRRAKVFVTTPLMPRGGMGEATCIPTAIAAVMIARGEITKRGAMGPEAFMEPTALIERLAPFAGDFSDQPPLDIRVVFDDEVPVA
jgi:saccharopine dehydrogenase-like NADP-dependent oxidoreductase